MLPAIGVRAGADVYSVYSDVRVTAPACTGSDSRPVRLYRCCTADPGGVDRRSERGGLPWRGRVAYTFQIRPCTLTRETGRLQARTFAAS
jgi:hypothetical protein